MMATLGRAGGGSLCAAGPLACFACRWHALPLVSSYGQRRPGCAPRGGLCVCGRRLQHNRGVHPTVQVEQTGPPPPLLLLLLACHCQADDEMFEAWSKFRASPVNGSGSEEPTGGSHN